MDPVKAIESENPLALIMLGAFGAFWIFDKILFYWSKWRNGIAIAHPRMGPVMDKLSRNQKETAEVVKELSGRMNSFANAVEKSLDRIIDDSDASRLSLQSIGETTQRIERRLERIN